MREHVNVSEYIYVRARRCQDKCLRELCALKWVCQSTHMGVGDQESVVVRRAMVNSREWGAQVLGVGLTHQSHPRAYLPVRGCTRATACKDLWHHPTYESHHWGN